MKCIDFALKAVKLILALWVLTGAFVPQSARAQEATPPAVIAQISPAVVWVTGYMRASSGQDEFERYASSSGFFVDEDGILFTTYSNYVDPETRRLCERFELVWPDGRIRQARAHAIDPVLNLAILKTIETEDYPMLDLAILPEITPGETVWAIAAAKDEDEGQSFSGLIKAKDNATMYAEGCANQLIDIYFKLPDHAYGGPLVNASGELLGMNMAFPRKEGCEEDAGEEHAVPMSDVAPIYKVLVANPTFDRKWLGFSVNYINMDLMAMVRQVMQKRCGILIDFVWQDGPAAQADIQKGDILVMINEKTIMTPTQFRGQLYRAENGTMLELKLIRKGALLSRQIQIEKRPPWAAL